MSGSGWTRLARRLRPRDSEWAGPGARTTALAAVAVAVSFALAWPSGAGGEGLPGAKSKPECANMPGYLKCARECIKELHEQKGLQAAPEGPVAKGRLSASREIRAKIEEVLLDWTEESSVDDPIENVDKLLDVADIQTLMLEADSTKWLRMMPCHGACRALEKSRDLLNYQREPVHQQFYERYREVCSDAATHCEGSETSTYNQRCEWDEPSWRTATCTFEMRPATSETQGLIAAQANASTHYYAAVRDVGDGEVPELVRDVLDQEAESLRESERQVWELDLDAELSAQLQGKIERQDRLASKRLAIASEQVTLQPILDKTPQFIRDVTCPECWEIDAEELTVLDEEELDAQLERYEQLSTVLGLKPKPDEVDAPSERE